MAGKKVKGIRVWGCLLGSGIVLWSIVYIQYATAEKETRILQSCIERQTDTLIPEDEALDAAEVSADSLNEESVVSDDERDRSFHSDTAHGMQETESQKQCVPVNTATIDELVTLPGIGPVLAERIVSFRQKQGDFTEASDLIKVKGIGEGTVKKIKKHICF